MVQRTKCVCQMGTIDPMKYDPDAQAINNHNQLEILSALPKSRPPKSTPLLFVHGAYSAAWCWQEHFLAFFAEAGFASYAVSLSGHGKSRGRKMLDQLSIDDYVRDVEEAAAGLRAPPVLIGHSMGGFVVQKVLERRVAPAAVLMCSVPPQGLMASAVGLMFSKPHITPRNPSVSFADSRRYFRHACFSAANGGRHSATRKTSSMRFSLSACAFRMRATCPLSSAIFWRMRG